MTIQAINSQPLRPAVSFKAESEAASSVTTEVTAKENKSKNVAGWSTAAVLALMASFGIYKLAKNGNKHVFKQIKDGVRELVNKKGEQIRIYESKDGAQKLITKKDKSGKLLKMIRTRNFEPQKPAAFEDALAKVQEERGLKGKKLEKILPTSAVSEKAHSVSPNTNPLIPSSSRPLKYSDKVKLPEAKETFTKRTTVENFVKADGTIAEKPVNVVEYGVLSNGTRVRYNESKDLMNCLTKDKDGKTTLSVLNAKHEVIASASHKDGQIIEATKNMDAKLENGKLVYTLLS